jgi:hypothetical protein
MSLVWTNVASVEVLRREQLLLEFAGELPSTKKGKAGSRWLEVNISDSSGDM